MTQSRPESTTRKPARKTTILCVDDEPGVLSGLTRVLSREFDVLSATSAAAALETLAQREDIAVVMSDMRMPGRNGADLLSEVKVRWPNVVRLLLTGHADLQSAMAAVNEGEVFRFLTKPCTREALAKALRDAVRQHELAESEHVLLDQTLRGALGLVTDVLGLLTPELLTPLLRLRSLVRSLAQILQLEESWHVELAAMFWQISRMTLPPDVADRNRLGRLDSAEEKLMVRRCNWVAQRMVAQVPRLERVRDLIREAGRLDGEADAQVSLEALIVRESLEYSGLVEAGVSARVAIASVARRNKSRSPKIAQALKRLYEHHEAAEETRVALALLQPGMILAEPLKTKGGLTIAAAENEVTTALLEQIQQFAERQPIREPVLVRVLK